MTLTWTTQRPTVPGWYWLDWFEVKPQVVLVTIRPSDSYSTVWFNGTEISETVEVIHKDWESTRWAGPIPEPGEEKT